MACKKAKDTSREERMLEQDRNRAAKALRRQEAEEQRKNGKKAKKAAALAGLSNHAEPLPEDSLSLGGFLFATKKVKGKITHFHPLNH